MAGAGCIMLARLGAPGTFSALLEKPLAVKEEALGLAAGPAFAVPSTPAVGCRPWRRER